MVVKIERLAESKIITHPAHYIERWAFEPTITGSLFYIFANLGELLTIIFMERINHSFASATCAVTGLLRMFCLCWGLAKVVLTMVTNNF